MGDDGTQSTGAWFQGASDGTSSSPLLGEGVPTQETRPEVTSDTVDPEEEHFREGLAALTSIAEERSKALADGVTSVLEEEMQSLERRQKQQEQSMDQMQGGVQALRQLVAKLNQTCVEISQLSAESSASSRQGRALRMSIGADAKGTLAIADSNVPDASKSSELARIPNQSATFTTGSNPDLQ